MVEPLHPAAAHPLTDPTKQIRLLRLRADNGELASAELSTWDLDKAPSYNAMSYRWGDPTKLHNLTIDRSPYNVGWNCWYALWQASLYVSPEDYVWLDAICINQAVKTEKSAQVGIMAGIYGRSERVLVSLGNATEDDIWLVEMLHCMDHDCGTLKGRNVPRASWWYKMEPDARARFYKALTSFGSKPYWRRLWIVQELYMAPSRVLMCGTVTLDPAVIQRFLREMGGFVDGVRDESDGIQRRLDDSQEDPSEPPIGMFLVDYHHTTGIPMAVLISKLEDLNEEDSVQQVRSDIVTILERFEQWQCSDMRDHVFGLLALIVETDRSFKPDYVSSVLHLALAIVGSFRSEYHGLQLAIALCRILQLGDTEEWSDTLDRRQTLYDPCARSPGTVTRPPYLVAEIYNCCTIWAGSHDAFISPARSMSDEHSCGVTSTWRTPPGRNTGLEVASQHKMVFTAEGSFALVCLEAQPGDRVLLLEKKRDYNSEPCPNIGLVMRKQRFRRFAIIGYAIIFADFWACDMEWPAVVKCGYPDLPHLPPHQTTFSKAKRLKVMFSPADLLVFANFRHALQQKRDRPAEWFHSVLRTRATESEASSYVVASAEPAESWEPFAYKEWWEGYRSKSHDTTSRDTWPEIEYVDTTEPGDVSKTNLCSAIKSRRKQSM